MSIAAFTRMCPESVCKPEGDIDNLFVDLSGLTKTIPASNVADLETKVFDYVIQKTRDIHAKSVTIACDGPLPLARLMERRRQNHLEARMRKETDGPTTFGVLSSAGTKFMIDLSSRICDDLKGSDTEVKTLPPSMAGEAACKIVCSIAKTNDDDLNCVLGVSSLELFTVQALEKKSVCFVTENVENTLNLSLLREALSKFVNSRCNHSLTPLSCLRDVCFLTTLDLLGPLPGACCSFERITAAFGDAVRISKEKSLCEKNGLNKKLLLAFLSQLKKTRFKQNNERIAESKVQRVVKVSTSEDKWRQRFWKIIFNVDVNCDGKKKAIVKRYMTGLVWYLSYLDGSNTDWQWYYAHDAAPPLEDLIDYIDCLDDVQLGKNRPIKPLESLALSVDHANIGLLPKGYGDLVETKLAYLYPEDVEIVSIDGTPIARLPSFESVTVLQAVKSLKLNVPEKERNKLDR